MIVTFAEAAFGWGRLNSTKGCRSDVPETMVSHIILYIVMTSDGSVVQRSPYFQMLEMEKWEETEDEDTSGTDVTPFCEADRLWR